MGRSVQDLFTAQSGFGYPASRYSAIPTSRTFTVPAGVSSIKVYLWGAGAGGAGAANNAVASPGLVIFAISVADFKASC